MMTMECDNFGTLESNGSMFPNFHTTHSSGDGGDPDNFGPEKIDPTLTFESMGGCQELVEEVKSRIVFPILNPEFTNQFNQQAPKGILMYGPPGTGKTLFAQCLAAELSRLGPKKFSFFMRRATDVMTMWVGGSEKNLRRVFEEAVRAKPSILFFDEIDALAPNRNTVQGSVPVYVNIVATLLVEMDKLRNGEVIVICATNRIDAIDPALKRPGRCDVVLQFHPPTDVGRRQILVTATKGWKSSVPSCSLLDFLVEETDGYTGADLQKLCNEAFFACVRRSRVATNGRVSQVPMDSTFVTGRDWMEALGVTEPSPQMVFGSYLKYLRSSKCVEPLLQTVAYALGDCLLRHWPTCTSKSSHTFATSRCTESDVEGPNCYLVWTPVHNDEHVLEFLVVPQAVKALDNPAVFELSERAVYQNSKALNFLSIQEIVQQAMKHPKPSLLFIPGIDKLVGKMAGDLSLFKSLLFKTASTSTFVLATASCPVSSLPTSIQALFEGFKTSCCLQRPLWDDIRMFFSQIFQEDGQGLKRVDKTPVDRKRPLAYNDAGPRKKSKGSKLADQDLRGTLLEDIVKETEHDPLWSIIAFHRQLTQAYDKFQHQQGHSRGSLDKVLRAIYVDYQRSKLRK